LGHPYCSSGAISECHVSNFGNIGDLPNVS
jgi:hypothetical protein